MKQLYSFILSLLLLGGCSVVSPYSSLEEMEYEGYHSYLAFPNQESLLIYLDGSGLTSVLGRRENLQWKETHFPYFLVSGEPAPMSIFIPEKLNFGKGEDHNSDLQALADYRVETLVDSYVAQIDHFLDHHRFAQIYLFGLSEGGALAPKVYNQLKHRSQISKMVIWGSGALDQYQSFRLLQNSPAAMPVTLRDAYRAVDMVAQEVERNPDSVDQFYMGLPYTRWSSFFHYRPFDEYQFVYIPVLFIHGTEDINSPVKSLRYLQTHLPGRPFEYQYIERMGHLPRRESDIRLMISMLYEWLQTGQFAEPVADKQG